jgi:hypothetical protein
MNILNEFYQGNADKAEELNTYIMDNRLTTSSESIVRKVDVNKVDV